MQLRAYILVTTMLFLLVQPMVLRCQDRVELTRQMACCKGKTCHKPAEKKTSEKDCDKTNTCNPFAGCSQAQYTNVSRFFYQQHIASDQPIRKSLPVVDTQAGFMVDCWHPPELSLV